MAPASKCPRTLKALPIATLGKKCFASSADELGLTIWTVVHFPYQHELATQNLVLAEETLHELKP